jgi:hypothetical protein
LLCCGLFCGCLLRCCLFCCSSLRCLVCFILCSSWLLRRCPLLGLLPRLQTPRHPLHWLITHQIRLGNSMSTGVPAQSCGLNRWSLASP